MKTFKNFTEPQKTNICPLCLERHMDNIYIQSVKESLNFKISSLQISVPLKGCINTCKSCIARISGDSGLYQDHSKESHFDDKYFESLKKVKELGCKNIVLTSDKGEPLQNKLFLQKIGDFNKQLDDWFSIEIQTTGVLLDGNVNFLKNVVGVQVVSLSIFDIFDEQNNQDIISVKEKLKFDIKKLSKEIKSAGMILRLSINLVNVYNQHSVDEFFHKINELNPNQVTVKNLWHTEDDNAINKWIKVNKANPDTIQKIAQYMDENGGTKVTDYRYDFNGRSIWMVDNCMLGNYLILRPDTKLYRSWSATSPIDLGV